MGTSVWQVRRSLRHKAGCTFRQSLRLWICWVRHRSWTWTETYPFVIVLGHGQSPILSNKTLHKLDVTVRLLLWTQERRMCETMQSSHRPRPVMALVHAFFSTDCVRWCHWWTFLCDTAVFVSLFRGMSWKDSRISWKSSFFLLIFMGGDPQSRHQEVTVESVGNFEDYIRFLSCHLFGPVNHGQTWKG